MDLLQSLLHPKSLATAVGETHDEHAVRIVDSLEKLVGRPSIDRDGHFRAVFGAIESMVEAGKAHPPVLKPLGDTLLVLGAVHGLPAATVKKLRKGLDQLQRHAESSARRR